MMKKLLFLLIGNLYFAQTSNPNLNRDLNAMKNSFLKKDFETFVEYIYPKSFELTGGKSNTVMMMKMIYAKMGKDISIQSLTYKNPGKFINQNNEIQVTIDEESVIKTPKGTSSNKNAVIAISSNKGKNWTFINTLNQSKENLIKAFPNLSKKLEIKSNSTIPKANPKIKQ